MVLGRLQDALPGPLPRAAPDTAAGSSQSEIREGQVCAAEREAAAQAQSELSPRCPAAPTQYGTGQPGCGWASWGRLRQWPSFVTLRCQRSRTPGLLSHPFHPALTPWTPWSLLLPLVSTVTHPICITGPPSSRQGQARTLPFGSRAPGGLTFSTEPLTVLRPSCPLLFPPLCPGAKGQTGKSLRTAHTLPPPLISGH